MSFTALDYSIWIAINVCHCILLLLLWRSRSRPNISFFTAFIVFKTAQSVIFITVFHLVMHHLTKPIWYARAFTVLLIPDYFLQLGTLYQLYYRLLKQHKVLPRRAFYVFLMGCVLILSVSAIISMQQPASLSTRIASIFTDFSRSINLLQCAGYFFVVAFASSLGLPARHSIVGIALGMGISRLGDLALAAIVSQWGLSVYLSIRYLPDLTYLCSTLIWIDYLRREESAVIALHPGMLAILQKLQQHVDRFFSRRQNRSTLTPQETHEDSQRG